MKPLLLSAFLLLALTGCAATPKVAAQPSPSTASVTASPTADSSVAQWASVIAEQSAYLAQWKTKWDDGNCVVVMAQSDLTCGMQALTGTMVVETVATSLKIPASTASKGYIGTPPTEIASLYADTQSLADAAVEAGASWTATCNSTPDAPDCMKLTFDFDSAVSRLSGKFAAWAPYL